MCGIAGILTPSGKPGRNFARLRAMTDAMAHRGPDGAGYLAGDSGSGAFEMGAEGLEHRHGDVWLGHRRLAIIDLSPRGRQPMRNETGELFLVFSGEVFNYLELRPLLRAKGHVFRSESDSEVVIHAYEEWGPDCVTRFNGMWALAIWDQRRRELFCSRDRFGIKPFYYVLEAGEFLFASEVKGLLPAMASRPRADLSVVRDYLVHGALCHRAETFFEGVRRLEPAHNLSVGRDGIRIRRYWDYDRRSEAYDDRRPVETFRGLFEDAVALRLRSDVPAGVALSGGLDSTSVLACAARLNGGRALTAFTAVFPGERFDEGPYARLASEALGARLLCTSYGGEGFVPALGRVVRSLDYPAVDGQVLLRWQLMRLAGRHVKVVLEGQGADEMLGGYVGRYFSAHVLDELGRLRLPGRRRRMRRLVGACLEAHRRHGWPHWSLFARRIRSLLSGGRMAPGGGLPYRQEFLRLPGAALPAPARWRYGDRLTRRMHFDHSTGLLPLLLKYGDALSMAASVESRLPFLDHRLVEFVFGLPPHHKLDGALSKGILRRAMAGAIPEEIRARRDKIGFATPTGKWIAACLDSEVRPLLLSRRCRQRGIFDTARIGALLRRPALENPPTANLVLRWVSAEVWFRVFIDGDGGAGLPGGAGA